MFGPEEAPGDRDLPGAGPLGGAGVSGVSFPPNPAIAPGRHSGHENLRRSLEYSRALQGPEAQLLGKEAEADTGIAQAHEQAAKRKGETDTELDARRLRENADYAKIRDDRQRAIDAYVNDKAFAEQDLSAGFWANRGAGEKALAALMVGLGGLGAAYTARSAARLGQVVQPKNQGMAALERIMEEDYRAKQNRVRAAGDAVLQARYGFKDAADNHRAALNDIDAESAARYRNIANEMEVELARRGVDKSLIAQDKNVLAMKEKATAREQGIFEREDNRDVTERGQWMRLQAALAADRARQRGEEDKIAKEMRGRAAAAVKQVSPDYKADLATHGVVNKSGGVRQGMLLPQNEALNKMKEAIKSDNGPAFKAALMEFDTISRNGPATKQSYDALHGSLGGAGAQFEDWMEGRATGKPGNQVRKNLMGAVDNAFDSNIAGLGAAHQAMSDKWDSPEFYGLKPHIEGEKTIWEQARDKNGKQVFTVHRDPNARGINRLTGEVTATTRDLALQNPANQAALDWLQTHQNAPGAAEVRETLARQGIDVR